MANNDDCNCDMSESESCSELSSLTGSTMTVHYKTPSTQTCSFVVPMFVTPLSEQSHKLATSVVDEHCATLTGGDKETFAISINVCFLIIVIQIVN